eukprot:1137047-Pelagomonas_calceolata.AAC.2
MHAHSHPPAKPTGEHAHTDRCVKQGQRCVQQSIRRAVCVSVYPRMMCAPVIAHHNHSGLWGVLFGFLAHVDVQQGWVTCELCFNTYMIEQQTPLRAQEVNKRSIQNLPGFIDAALQSQAAPTFSQDGFGVGGLGGLGLGDAGASLLDDYGIGGGASQYDSLLLSQQHGVAEGGTFVDPTTGEAL